MTRGARSGRVAWQYIQDLAGRQKSFTNPHGGGLPPEKAFRVDGLVAAAQFEMKLRFVDATRTAHFRNHLTPSDLLSSAHKEF